MTKEQARERAEWVVFGFCESFGDVLLFADELNVNTALERPQLEQAVVRALMHQYLVERDVE